MLNLSEKVLLTLEVLVEMFSSFWDQAYFKSFEGGTVLAPAVHPGMDMNVFPTLGTILSHAFVCPVLAALVSGPSVSLP